MPDNLGSQADAAVTNPASDATITAALKGLLTLLAGTLTIQEPLSVDDNGGSLTVDGPLTDAQLRASDLPVTLDGETVVLAAGSALVGKVQPFDAVKETGAANLITADQQVDQYDYGASAAVALGGTYSGEILAATFLSAEAGTGSIRRPAGKLLLLDADPSLAAGATSLGAGNWPAVLGFLDVDTGDWTTTDTSGAVACILNQPVPFHALSTLYLVWFHEDAASFNDAAGDDESLRVNLWYRRDS